jgi:OFA family oxalate/formate antiporter-like MFS transporter
VFYSVFCGIGVGMGYNSTLHSVLKWFPDKQGIASGILLMGFGFGGSLLGSLAVYMMMQFGWRVTFRVVGATLSFFIILSSFLVKQPSPEELSEIKAGKNKKGALKPAESEDIPASKMIRERSFWGYILWAALRGSAGLAIIGNTASMSGFFTKNIVEAVFVAGLVNIASGIGRLSFGFLFDSIGSRRSLFIITGGLLCSMILLITAFSTGLFIILGIGFIITGLSYGGIASCNSAYTGKVFGQKYYPANFSIINANVLAAAFLGPYCAGLIQTKNGGYITMILVLGAYCILGIPALLLISRHSGVQKSTTSP